MIKRILHAVSSVLIVFVLTYNLHHYLNQEILGYSLFQVYLFHAIATAIICVVVELIANQLPDQAGYTYLMFMCFKIGGFVILFQESVFLKDVLSKADRIGLVAPLFIFLIVEAYFIYKTLNAVN